MMGKNIIFKNLLILSIMLTIIPKTLSNQPQNNGVWSNFLDQNLSLNTTDTWHEFVHNHEKFKEEKWVWVGSITMKTKNALKLKKINLSWSGKKLKTDKIGASLYQKKERNQIVLPVEKNLVCDGTWDGKKQQIVFHLNEKIVAVNKFYLVISFPEEIKSTLRAGSFILTDNDSLQLININ